MSSSEVIIKEKNCFVCGSTLSPNSRSVMDSTRFSQKPIYKFIESFVGSSFNLPMSTKAALCEDCLSELQEYEKICRRAAKIQEHISEIFKQTQQNYKESSKQDIDSNECMMDDEVANYIEYVVEEEEEEEEEEEDEEVSMKQQEKESKRKSENLTYTCSTCNKSFDKKRDYSQHVKLAHLPDGSQIYACELCDEYENYFASELELKFHNVVKHPTDKNQPLQCPGCPKNFSNKSLLTRHFGLHLQDKPLVCELCGKRYFHSSSFHMHMVAHRGIKQHSCKECGRSFISTSHLNRHLKTHSGVKNYECQECGSRFAQRYNLKAHMNIHYGVSRRKKPKVVEYGDL